MSAILNMELIQRDELMRDILRPVKKEFTEWYEAYYGQNYEISNIGDFTLEMLAEKNAPIPKWCFDSYLSL